MLRNVGYRTAINLFVFAGLWLFIGALVVWSPLPGALGILGGFFAAWVLLFFGVLAFAGAALTVAALNAAFPRSAVRPPGGGRRAAAAPPARTAAPRTPVTAAPPRTRRPPASSARPDANGGNLWAPPSRYDG